MCTCSWEKKSDSKEFKTNLECRKSKMSSKILVKVEQSWLSMQAVPLAG